MDITETISANLKAWMSASTTVDTIQKLESRSGVGYGTVRRARSGSGNLTVENLAKLAAAFGRTPIDLITPQQHGDGANSAPGEPRSVAYVVPMSDMQNGCYAAESRAEYAWPFALVGRSAFEALTDQGKGYVEGCLKKAIEEAAAQYGTPGRKRSA
jgi:transcriptional regulator with XRE-family HTH domain